MENTIPVHIENNARFKPDRTAELFDAEYNKFKKSRDRNTNMKYIQEQYIYYSADESMEILGKGREIKPAEESLR